MEFDRIRQIKSQAKERLFAIPGVHAVGIGPKIVNGVATGEPAIIAFVLQKRALVELPENEIIPSDIESVKTDVIETPLPHHQDDTAPYRPLRGGIQIAVNVGGAVEGGTLGCIARTDEPTPRIVAITNHHVVASQPKAQPTSLSITPIPGPPTQVQLAGSNTPGTLVRVGLHIGTTGSADVKNFDTFYVTKDGDNFATIAINLATQINTNLNPSLQADPDPSGSVTLQPAAGNSIVSISADTYGAHVDDPSISLHAVMHDPTLLHPPFIEFSGLAASEYFASVNINVGGVTPTQSRYIAIHKGDTAETVAQNVAGAVTSMALNGVTATVQGAQLAIDGAEEIECDVFDPRVGQPTPTFATSGCSCIEQGIGHVIDAKIELDAALVQLNPGLKYRAAIEEIGAVAGSSAVSLTDLMDGTNPKLYPVRKRGRTTALRQGWITALHVDGFASGDDQPRGFQRTYANAMAIQPTSPATTGDTTNNSPTIANIPAGVISGISAGLFVTGPGIPAASRVVSVGPTSVTISANASATAAGVNLTFSTGPSARGDTTTASPTIANIPAGAILGISAGMSVAGAGIPAGASVVGVGATNVTMDANATATAAGVNLTFFQAFSAGGDSGSAVVSTRQETDDQGHPVTNNYIVGILFSGTPATTRSPARTFATPFEDIRDGLQVALETSTDPNEERTVPAAPHATPSFHAAGFSGLLEKQLQQAERRLAAMPAGEEYVFALRRHAGQAAALIDANRRLATAWHRNRGPRVLQSVLEWLWFPRTPLAQTIDGEPLAARLHNLQNSFARYGDPHMARDFGKVGSLLARSAGRTYEETLTFLDSARSE
jgi:hypothetical protein